MIEAGRLRQDNMHERKTDVRQYETISLIIKKTLSATPHARYLDRNYKDDKNFFSLLHLILMCSVFTSEQDILELSTNSRPVFFTEA